MNTVLAILYPWIPALILIGLGLVVLGFLIYSVHQNKKKLAKMAADRNTMLSRYNVHR